MVCLHTIPLRGYFVKLARLALSRGNNYGATEDIPSLLFFLYTAY